MGRRKRRGDEDNGFAEWGGYMEAKKAKLQEQFLIDAAKEPSNDSSTIFNGIAIFVNGYSVPSADELKLLMMKHGGVYHHYFRSEKTTHIIATNLPDTKVKQLKNMNVVKPDWIVDSIAAGKLLDYRQYLLYSHQSKTQPKLTFKSVEGFRNVSSTCVMSVAENETRDNNYNENSSSEDVFNSEKNCIQPNLYFNVDTNNINSKRKPEEESEFKSVPSTSKNPVPSIKTASEAGFLAEFYSNSRLHHISTMGATFKQYVNNLRKNNNGYFPGIKKLKTLNNSQIYLSTRKRNSCIIMHIDMDCFFVSVGLRKRPDLKGFPVAVTHAKGEKNVNQRSGVDRKAEFELYKTRREEKVKSKNQPDVEISDVKPWSDWAEDIDEFNSMSEIASCNYEARNMGLKNGMFLGQAFKLCPTLKTIPYDFEGYKEVSYCLYDTVASYTLDIEAVSCDEMFVDCTSLLNEIGLSPLDLASTIREEIKEKTGCPCSAGFGANRLQARLATKRAKPDGQFYLEPTEVQEFMENINVSDLPGVGRSTSFKLSSMGIKTCSDLQQLTLAKLQAEFGVKSGDSLYKHCRGEDPRKLVFGQVRKSVSAEVNYGIRFHNGKEADTFLRELSKEVHNRLQEINMKTRLVTLKLMTRSADAPVETAKFLGHGICDHVSRSATLASAVNDLDTITREVLALSRQLNAKPTELRGIGIQLSKLESAKCSKPSGNVIDKFLRPKSETDNTREENILKQNQPINILSTQETSNKPSTTSIDNFFAVKKHTTNQSQKKSSHTKKVKPMDIDKDVLEALPEEIRKEVMLEYGLTPSDLEIRENPKPTEMEKCLKLINNDEDESSNDRVHYGLNYSQIDLQVLDELPLEIKREIESTIPKKRPEMVPELQDKTSLLLEANTSEAKLDQNLSVREVRALITAWTSAEECPQPCDVAMLTEYLQGLVTSHQLDSLDVCVNCLHRCIEKRKCNLWQETYHSMIDNLQLVMISEYGLRLHVPNKFRML